MGSKSAPVAASPTALATLAAVAPDPAAAAPAAAAPMSNGSETNTDWGPETQSIATGNGEEKKAAAEAKDPDDPDATEDEAEEDEKPAKKAKSDNRYWEAVDADPENIPDDAQEEFDSFEELDYGLCIDSVLTNATIKERGKKKKPGRQIVLYPGTLQFVRFRETPTRPVEQDFIDVIRTRKLGFSDICLLRDVDGSGDVPVLRALTDNSKKQEPRPYVYCMKRLGDKNMAGIIAALVENTMFNDENKFIYYVCASRNRHWLRPLPDPSGIDHWEVPFVHPAFYKVIRDEACEPDARLFVMSADDVPRIEPLSTKLDRKCPGSGLNLADVPKEWYMSKQHLAAAAAAAAASDAATKETIQAILKGRRKGKGKKAKIATAAAAEDSSDMQVDTATSEEKNGSVPEPPATSADGKGRKRKRVTGDRPSAASAAGGGDGGGGGDSKRSTTTSARASITLPPLTGENWKTVVDFNRHIEAAERGPEAGKWCTPSAAFLGHSIALQSALEEADLSLLYDPGNSDKSRIWDDPLTFGSVGMLHGAAMSLRNRSVKDGDDDDKSKYESFGRLATHGKPQLLSSDVLKIAKMVNARPSLLQVVGTLMLLAPQVIGMPKSGKEEHYAKLLRNLIQPVEAAEPNGRKGATATALFYSYTGAPGAAAEAAASATAPPPAVEEKKAEPKPSDDAIKSAAAEAVRVAKAKAVHEPVPAESAPGKEAGTGMKASLEAWKKLCAIVTAPNASAAAAAATASPPTVPRTQPQTEAPPVPAAAAVPAPAPAPVADDDVVVAVDSKYPLPAGTSAIMAAATTGVVESAPPPPPPPAAVPDTQSDPAEAEAVATAAAMAAADEELARVEATAAKAADSAPDPSDVDMDAIAAAVATEAEASDATQDPDVVMT